MDTKLKSNYLPVLSLVLSVYLVSLSLFAAADYQNHERFLDKDYYFRSYAFESQLDAFTRIVGSYYSNYNDYANLTTVEKVGEEQYQSIQRKFDSARQGSEIEVQTQFDQKLKDATKANDTKLIAMLNTQKAQKLEDIRQTYATKFNETIKELVLHKDQEYEDLRSSLASKNESIRYYIQDRKTNNIYTNMGSAPDRNYLQTQALFSIKLPLQPTQEYSLWSVTEFFRQNNWDGYIIIPKEVTGFSQIHADYQYYQSIRDRIIKEAYLGSVTLVAGLLLLLLSYSKGWLDLPFVTYCTNQLRRIPLDIRAGVFLIVSLLLFIYVNEENVFYYPIGFSQVFMLSLSSLLFTFLLLNVKTVLPLLRNREELINQWHKSFCSTLIRLVKNSFIVKSILFKVIVLLALTGLYGVFLGWLFIHPGSDKALFLAFVYTLFYVVLVVPYILKRIGAINRILQGTEEIAMGNLNYVITETGRGNLSSLAHNINNMKQGFKKSLESQMKSERLKSELITNVSHDLKTPLTSIINYVNLLKREDLSHEDMQKYVDVLDRKAQRLKILIEDLFEASKMASGAVELEIETVDVAALLTQALAEYDERIESSTLTFKVKTEHPKMYARLDGKKTWRVLENLISNALKYSFPNSRVYLSLTEQADKVILTMQNTSAYEIDFDVDEIFERFKRGDQSRNTEGSGLGLAIAKSIMELQGGALRIEIDGDHFKAIAEFVK